MLLCVHYPKLISELGLGNEDIRIILAEPTKLIL